MFASSMFWWIALPSNERTKTYMELPCLRQTSYIRAFSYRWVSQLKFGYCSEIEISLLFDCRYFQEVLASPKLSSDTNEIQLNNDGSWSTHVQRDECQNLDTPASSTQKVEIISDDLGEFLFFFCGTNYLPAVYIGNLLIMIIIHWKINFWFIFSEVITPMPPKPISFKIANSRIESSSAPNATAATPANPNAANISSVSYNRKFFKTIVFQFVTFSFRSGRPNVKWFGRWCSFKAEKYTAKI